MTFSSQPAMVWEFGLSTPSNPNQAEATITVPNNELWELINISFRYIADATVGDRYLTVEATLGGTGRYISYAFSTFNQTAGQQNTYHFQPGLGTANYFTGATIVVPMQPKVYIPGNGVDSNIRIFNGIPVSAGDRIENIVIRYKLFKNSTKLSFL